MPYFAIENTDWTDGFIGLAFTMGYLPQEKCFSAVITIGVSNFKMGT